MAVRRVRPREDDDSDSSRESPEYEDSPQVALVHTDIRKRINAVGKKGAEAVDGDEESMDVLKDMIVRAADTLVESRTHHKKKVRKLLAQRGGEYVDSMHKKYLKGDNLEAFLEKKQRLTFRRDVYNALCAEGELGLSIRDYIRGPIVDNKYEKMIKSLGTNASAFERICNSFDGHNIRTALETMIKDASKVKRKRLDSRADKRSAQKYDITVGIASRAQDQIAKAMLPPQQAKVLGIMSREGVDTAMKIGGGALAIFGSGPLAVAGVGIYAARGITEAVGYDFGQVVSKAFSKIGNKAKISGKQLLSVMVEKWRDKLNPEFRNWLERAPIMSTEKLHRASLSFPQRMKVLGRGMIPFMSLGGKAKEEGTAEVIQEQNDLAEQSITRACEKAVKNFKRSTTSRAAGHRRSAA